MGMQCNNDLDIRIIRLSKCHIPKNSPILPSDTNINQYLAIGYFDMVDVIKVEPSKNNHPLFDAYKNSYRWEDDIDSLMKEYSTQELIVFTNIGKDGFEKQKIESFWSGAFDVRFISMIHVDNEISENVSLGLNVILEKINELFEGKEYLYYYSFDYSGIVLLANDMTVEEYLKNLFYLNYNLENGTNLIRDSFSLCGISRRLLQKNHNEIEQKMISEKDYWRESYTAVTNIGIIDYTKYKKFWEELSSKSKAAKDYGLLGRQDVSIVNPEANLKWLLLVQGLLDKYTSDKENAFYSYETFIKVKVEWSLDDLENTNKREDSSKESRLSSLNYTDHTYQKVEEELSNRYKNLKEKFDKRIVDKKGNLTNKTKKDQYGGEYLAPLKAVQYSMLSILRNGFAEDFVICIYQSFIEFLDYLIEKVSNDKDDINAFDKTFNEYFRSLNSLVNSAMHSERQFVQATAFNAIIYDIPSKVMAFYVAIIEDIQKIVRDEKKDKKYTFLLTPSFSNEISVNVISYEKENPPHDRILRVSINEQTLYSPNAVIRRMAHEVAHYVGDDLRCRIERKRHILSSIVHLLLYHLIPKCLYNEKWNDFVEKISAFLIEEKFPLDVNNYSKSLNYLAGEVVGCFYSRKKIKDEIQNYIKDSICNINSDSKINAFKTYFLQVIKYSIGEESKIFQNILNETCFTPNEIEFLSNIIISDIYAEIDILNTDLNIKSLPYNHKSIPSSISGMANSFLNHTTLSLYTNRLVSVYSEAFADMQMILLLNLTYKQYIIGFVCEEDIDIERFDKSLEDSMRICVVTKLMVEVGFWNIPVGEECFNDFWDEAKRDQLNKLHKKVQNQIQIVRNTLDVDDSDHVIETMKKFILDFKNKTDSYSEEEIEQSNNKDDIILRDPLIASLWIRLEMYLLICLSKSVQHYLKRSEKIVELRKMISIIEDSKNIKEIFCTICTEISKYKKELFF